MRVFISSTIEDLKAYRDQAEEAVLRAGCTPTLLKYWGPAGRPPLSECLRKVAEADLLVVIVAHRYGWVPEGQPASERKSITWLECEEASRQGKEVLAFLLDDNYPWPEEFREKVPDHEGLR